ncbi:hypothetical protein D3C72_1635550 [compost metagenome]
MLCVRLQGHLAVGFRLTEDRLGGQRQLENITVHIVIQHHGDALRVAAGTRLVLTGTRHVLRAGRAGVALLFSRVTCRSNTVLRVAVGRSHHTFLVRALVERAIHSRGSSHNHHIHRSLILLSDLLTVDHQTEDTALDRDTLATATTGQSLSGCIHGRPITQVRGQVAGEQCDVVAHA